MEDKIPIVMPTYNRPEFLSQVLAGLKKCDNLQLFKIYTSEEPDCSKVDNLFSNVDFIEIERTKNSNRLGCNANVLQAIEIGFEHGDFIISLEDDVVPGVDFLNFCLWANDTLKHNRAFFGECVPSKQWHEDNVVTKYFVDDNPLYFRKRDEFTWA